MRCMSLLPGNYTIDPRPTCRRRRFGRGSRYTACEPVASAGGISGGRLVDVLTFHLALRSANNITVKPDAWFVMTEPPLIFNTVLQLRRQLGGRVIHHVDDLYPDLAMALGSLPRRGPIASLLGRWARAGLRNCDQVLALGECMAGVLKQKGVTADRLTITPPWADGSRLSPLDHGENRFRQEIGIAGDQLVVMYSGNMGLGHRFETILAAARSLAPNDKIHFVFIGDGAKKNQIDAFRQAHNLRNIMMLPYQPRERLRETLSAGDIHLISLDAQGPGIYRAQQACRDTGGGPAGQYLWGIKRTASRPRFFGTIAATSSPKAMSANSRR